MPGRHLVSVERDWVRFMAQVDFCDVAPSVQCLFLTDAMARLGMGRDDFAARIGVSKKGLSKWLADRHSKEFRAMPVMAWKFIGEILERPAKAA